MELNQLPKDYNEDELGPQKRQTEFDSPEAKLAYDAQQLIEIARLQSEKLGMAVDPITCARRNTKEDLTDIPALRAAIAKEQGAVSSDESADISPEQSWMGELKSRFEATLALHPGIEWSAVKKSLEANPEAMRKLQSLDEKGHAMNVFGKENGKFVFVSNWDDYNQVSSEHRDLNYDQSKKIATSMGVELADAISRFVNCSLRVKLRVKEV